MISVKLQDIDGYINAEQSTYVIITDMNLERLHLDELTSYLKGKNVSVLCYVVQAGESGKNLEVVKDIYSFLCEHRVDRRDCIVALGGGMIGDLAGFVSPTFLRGIRLIHIPILLLAQIDSSVGGKTAVNLLSLKNMVGAFYSPECVYINYRFLKTLPRVEICNGLIESVVHAIIADPELFCYMEQNLKDILELTEGKIDELIWRNCSVKASVVQSDEKEKGIRAILNFGHTMGHATEGSCNYEYKHGQCVALGILGACFISEELGFMKEETTKRIKNLLMAIAPFADVRGQSWEQIYQFMVYDKKIKVECIRYVLPKEIGTVFIHEIQDFSVIKRAYFRVLQEMARE